MNSVGDERIHQGDGRRGQGVREGVIESLGKFDKGKGRQGRPEWNCA